MSGKKKSANLKVVEISRFCDQVIEKGFYLLFFLVPLILTPFNYELFEYNKMMLVYLLTSLILAAWLIKMIQARKVIFRRTFLDLPLIAFFLTQLASYVFSIDRHTSFWGYYSRFHGGLGSTTAYLLLYWALVANFNKQKAFKLIRFLLASTFLVAIYGTLEHFGIDKDYWVQDVENRVFSTLGQPNWLAAFLVAIMPLTWALTLENQRKKSKTALYLFLSTLFYLTLIFTKSRSGFLGLGAAYLAFWGIIFIKNLFRAKKISFSKTFRRLPKTFFLFTIIIILLGIIAGTPWTPKLEHLIRKPQVKHQTSLTPVGGTESGQIRKIVWQGAIEIWRHHPILGTGPETFAYAYYNFRPREHNDVSEWDFLYNKAHNEYLNLAANTGTLGLVSYLAIIAAFLSWCLKKIKTEEKPPFLILALLGGYLSILVTNFFGFSVVAVSLLFFLYPAMGIALKIPEEKMEKSKKEKSPSLGQTLAITVVFLLTTLTLLTLVRFWQADTLFAEGKNLNGTSHYQEAFEKLQKAVQLNPQEPFYHDELAQSAASLAVLAQKQEEASLSAQLSELAIEESDQALKISPNHLNFLKNRTRIFYTLAEIDEKHYQEALASLLQATQLAPTDAKIFYNLAILYSRLNQNQTAILTLQKTIKLKPNYEAAHWALALFYEQENKTQEAREELEYILKNINPESQKVKEKLERL